MRFYIDQGAGMEAIPYDTHKIVSYLQSSINGHVWLENKYDWSNQPEIVCFEDTRDMLMYPEHALFHEWLWNNRLTVGYHWRQV